MLNFNFILFVFKINKIFRFVLKDAIQLLENWLKWRKQEKLDEFTIHDFPQFV